MFLYFWQKITIYLKRTGEKKRRRKKDRDMQLIKIKIWYIVHLVNWIISWYMGRKKERDRSDSWN